jgi:type III pantothenate kinase
LPLALEAAWLDSPVLGGASIRLGCTLASVNPSAAARFADWLTERGCAAQHVRDFRQLPLRIVVDRPEQVGLDRLLDAIAANSLRPAARTAIIASVGSAATVNLVDGTGAFRGGAILPGFRLMMQALHSSTAQLPLVEPRTPASLEPAGDTCTAITLGVFQALVGGIRDLSRAFTTGEQPLFYLTGGDSSFILEALGSSWQHWPHMTLEGLRRVALHLR